MFKQLLSSVLVGLSVLSVGVPAYSQPTTLDDKLTFAQEYCLSEVMPYFKEYPTPTDDEAQAFYMGCITTVVNSLIQYEEQERLEQSSLHVSTPDFKQCGYRLCETQSAWVD